MRSAHLNMQLLREDYDEALNAAKGNGTAETIKELYKLRQIMDDKKVDFMKNMRKETCVCNNVSHCNRVLINREQNPRNFPKQSKNNRKA